MKKMLLILIVSLIVSACSNESENYRSEIDISKSTVDNLLQENSILPDSLRYLKDYLINDLKFKEKDVVYQNDGFLLEKDMILTVEGLISLIDYNKVNGIDPAAHYASTGCGILNPSPVRANFCPGRNCSHDDEIYFIAVDILNIPNSWAQATINAINEWNNLPNNRVNFFITDRNCDIRAWDGIQVYLYSESNTNTIAIANLPVNGYPGYQIRINTNSTTYNSTNQNALTRTMVHEFGHTIGYRHTNETNGCFIPGSATVDGNSIMNSVLNPLLFGFSDSDIDAHNILYPNANSSARTIEFNCRI